MLEQLSAGVLVLYGFLAAGLGVTAMAHAGLAVTGAVSDAVGGAKRD